MKIFIKIIHENIHENYSLKLFIKIFIKIIHENIH